jgi:two-component system, OmpR family, phosphate regulon response regulator PhoB
VTVTLPNLDPTVPPRADNACVETKAMDARVDARSLTWHPEPVPAGAKSVLVVEDEPDVLELVAFHLGRSGYQVIRAERGREAQEQLRRNRPDLVILDLMLPDMSGLEILQGMSKDDRMRTIPVIILSARASTEDRVLGLELGAVDYVPKPFSPRELVLRVRTVLARNASDENERPLAIGELLIDRVQHRVTVAGEEITLTATEFRLLIFLAEHAGRVHDRDQLLDHVWGQDICIGPRTVDAHVANLRQKLGVAGDLVQTVRGFGYRFERP